MFQKHKTLTCVLKLWLVGLTFIACTHNTANQTKKGTLVIQSGVIDGKNTDANLTFNRSSFYQEMILLLDILAIPGLSIGPYFGWLNEDEKNRVKSCDKTLIILMYTFDMLRIRPTQVTQQIEDQGFVRISLNNFFDNLAVHPSYQENGLRFYKHLAYCGDKRTPKQVTLTLPGFNSLELDFEK